MTKLKSPEVECEVLGGEYIIHPLASVYPWIEPGPLWDDLKNSIRARGILNPCIRDEKTGMVVDGRNRIKAYLEVLEEQRAAGDPTFERVHYIRFRDVAFKSLKDIANHIRAQNNLRRDLTQDGRALAVTLLKKKVLELEGKEAKAPKKGEVRNPKGANQHGRIVDTDSCPQSKIEKPQRDIQEKHARSTVGQIAAEAEVSFDLARKAIKASETLAPEEISRVMTGGAKLRDVLPKAAPKAKAEKPAAPAKSTKDDPLDVCLCALDQLSKKELEILQDAVREKLGGAQ